MEGQKKVEKVPKFSRWKLKHYLKGIVDNAKPLPIFVLQHMLTFLFSHVYDLQIVSIALCYG